MAVVFFFEFRYMQNDWAGLPGFLLTLPLSVVVVVVGLSVEFLAGRYGSNFHVTDYHFEYGLIVCAFLNAFIWYPVYALWTGRKNTSLLEPPPPPSI